LFQKIVESLLSKGGKLKGKTIEMMSSGLVIRDKNTKHEYTIDRVSFDEGKPKITCYRYYGPDGRKKVFIDLTEKDFDNYEAV
jgi:hypothetical protein